MGGFPPEAGRAVARDCFEKPLRGQHVGAAKNSFYSPLALRRNRLLGG
jgi:hypothetical protein